MSIDITIQVLDAADYIPTSDDVTLWIQSAGQLTNTSEGELTIRFVGTDEMRDLNARWRGKDSPTNVLSFEFDDDGVVPVPVLGDVVVCASVVRDEATRFGVPLAARFAYIIVHGFLHLVGHRHDDPVDATRMESFESRVLQNIGFDDPWHNEVMAS